MPASDPAAPAIKPQSKRGGSRPGAGRKSTSDKLAQQIITALGAFPAADPWQPTRTYIYHPLVEPNRELDSATRLTLAGKARALYNRAGPAVRAIDFTARASVGIGLLPKPRGGDRQWKKKVKARFAAGPAIDPRFFDAARQVNYFEALDLLARQTFIDGDDFWQPLQASDGTTRVRLIEGVNVGNVQRPTSSGFKQDQWTDGARLDPLGAVTHWRVLNRPGGDAYTDVPASDLYQVKRSRRQGATRGVSWLAVAANHLHDLSDIVAFAKHAFKIGAQIPFVVTSDRDIGLGKGLTKSTDATTGQTQSTHDMLGEAGILRLKRGETISGYTNTVPGETFGPFTKELRREIAEGFGCPYNLAFDLTEVGGANNRALLVELQWLLDEVQWMLSSQFIRPWYLRWLWHEIEAGYIDYVDDWYAMDIATPAKPTVDAGRDGKHLLDQLAAGLLAPDYIQGLFGRDGEDMDELYFECYERRKERLAELQKEHPGATLAEVFGEPQEQPAAPPTTPPHAE